MVVDLYHRNEKHSGEQPFENIFLKPPILEHPYLQSSAEMAQYIYVFMTWTSLQLRNTQQQ